MNYKPLIWNSLCIPLHTKKVVELTLNPKAKDETSGFKFASNYLTGCTHVEEVVDNVSSTAAKASNNNIKLTHKRLYVVYITYINNVPVFFHCSSSNLTPNTL